jgi:RNA polymerase sigma-54 factor
MGISNRLQMRQGQSLVMTPQLQQAIKLLQLSNIELAEYVEAEIEKNPLILKGEGADAELVPSEALADKSPNELDLGNADAGGSAQSNLDAPTQDAYEADSPSEQVQPESGSASLSGPSGSVDWSGTGGKNSSFEDYDFESNATEDKTLRVHLTEQLTLAAMSAADKVVAQRLIDELD